MDKVSGTFTFLADGLVIHAVTEEGKLVSAKGEKVLAVQPIEMNTVLVHRTSGVEALELGTNVRWMPEREEGFLA